MGFSCMVIFGIFKKTLPIFLGIQEPDKKIGKYVLHILNISIALRIFSGFYREYTDNLYGFFTVIYCIAGFLETMGVFLFIYNLNLFDFKKRVKSTVNLPTGFRKYIRAALIWLFVSESALLTYTIYEAISVHFYPQLYSIMGFSGFIEYAAMFFFGINVWTTMRLETEEEPTEQIKVATASTNVYQLIKHNPQTLDILVKFGFKQLKNPILRNTLARTINMGQAVQINPVNLEDLLKEVT